MNEDLSTCVYVSALMQSALIYNLWENMFKYSNNVKELSKNININL